MRLGLSSAAAPDLPLAELLDACRRRGLTALELVAGDAHGVGPEAEPGEVGEALRRAEATGVRIAALACVGDGAEDAGAIVDLGARLGVPALLPVGGFLPVELSALVKRSLAAGGSVLLQHGTDPDAAAALRRTVEALPAGAAALAWEVDPARDLPARVAELLRVAGPALAHVRLRGGGPEAAEQTGLGVGALMARLALARYAGPLVLAPTTPRYHYVWRAWLGRAGGWGCGSKQADPSLVSLPLAAGG